MSKVSQKALAEYEKLLREKAESDLQIQMYRDANRIEFFDTAPNPGPNPLQAELLEAWLDPSLKVFTYCGANRIGKTTIGILIALSVTFGKFLWSDQKLHFRHTQPRKVRIVGQDWEKSIKTVLMPELFKWWPKNRPVKTKKNNQGIDAYWEDIKTKSTIEIMSNGQESDLHEGWSGDLIVYDEPPKRDIRVANARGLIDRNGRELFAMTLLKEAWVDREVIKKVLDDGRPDPSVFNVSGDIWSNVGFGITKEGVDQFESLLTDDEKSARIHGVPSYMSGLIYPTFSRKYREKGGHLVKRFQIPLDWMVDIAIDVHPREKQAVLFLATEPRNDRYICDEVWDNGNGKWIAESILRKVKYHSYRVNRVIIDPLSKGDGNNDFSVYETISTILMQHDMILETATKDKEQGILEVKNHLLGPNQQPSLFFFDDMIRTIYEIEGWMWDKDTQKPQDKDDHMMENLYRLALLKTQWSEPAGFYDYDDTPDYHHAGRDNTTGY